MNCFSGLQHGSWCRLRCWTGRWPPVFHVSGIYGWMGWWYFSGNVWFPNCYQKCQHIHVSWQVLLICVSVIPIYTYLYINKMCWMIWLWDPGMLRAIDLTGNMTPTGPPPADGLVWGQSCWLIDGPFMHSFDANLLFTYWSCWDFLRSARRIKLILVVDYQVG